MGCSKPASWPTGGVLGTVHRVSKPNLAQHHSTKTATNQLTDISLPLHHHPDESNKCHHFRAAQSTTANQPRHPLTDIMHQHRRREEDPGVVRAVGVD